MKKILKNCSLIVLTFFVSGLMGCAKEAEEEARKAVQPEQPVKVKFCFKETCKIGDLMQLAAAEQIMPDQVCWEVFLPVHADTMFLSHGEISIEIKSERLKNEIIQRLKGIILVRDHAVINGAGILRTILTIQSAEKRFIYDESVISLDVQIGEKPVPAYSFGYDPVESDLNQVEEILFSIYSELIQPFRIIPSSSAPELTILYAESEDWLIRGDLEVLSSSPGYPYLFENASDFDFQSYGLTAYENDQEIETLPDTPGNHFILFKKGEIQYFLGYRCE